MAEAKEKMVVLLLLQSKGEHFETFHMKFCPMWQRKDSVSGWLGCEK